jgi:hypothetical protein
MCVFEKILSSKLDLNQETRFTISLQVTYVFFLKTFFSCKGSFYRLLPLQDNAGEACQGQKLWLITNIR